MTERPKARRAELTLICGALAAVVLSLVSVAVFSMEILSAARGYTQGEALWSKGQKDAIFYLTRYAQTSSDADYERFRAAIHVPLACRVARRQMDLPSYNTAILSRGFAEVGIHEDDRNRMVRLYRTFSAEPHLARALTTWIEAERYLDTLDSNGKRLRQRILSHTSNQALIDETVAENDRINRALTPLEARFSASLAEASRWLHTCLTTLISILAAFLIAAGSAAYYVLFRRIAASEDKLRSARDRALDASRAKSQFLANMSHEIRTPMNGVIGMIGLALDRCSDAEQKEQLDVALTAAQALLAVINDILDLSKIEAGKMSMEAIDFNLREACGQALRMFEPVTRQKAIRLDLSFRSDCPVWVRGDPVRLRQVLVNLAGNAVKFTEHGAVEIRVSGYAGGVRFEVRDTGIGIAPEKLDTIFEAFTQADSSHARQFGGSGLGLTITRRLTDLMEGRIWAESTKGLGSCFFVELPLLARPPAIQKAAQSSAPEAGIELQTLNVLVAEDNLINQKVICAMLKRFGWAVTLASNGREAHERFLESRFDLLLMDVQMPEVDGFEATRLIRRSEESSGSPRHTPILALTAHASKEQHDLCLAAGMEDVITKPVTPAQLLDVIAIALAAKTPTAA